MEKVVARAINTFKHFMAYKGALMVNDDEMFASFQRCSALGALPLYMQRLPNSAGEKTLQPLFNAGSIGAKSCSP